MAYTSAQKIQSTWDNRAERMYNLIPFIDEQSNSIQCDKFTIYRWTIWFHLQFTMHSQNHTKMAVNCEFTIYNLNLLLLHGQVAHSDTHAKNLLELELDCSVRLIYFWFQGVLVSNQSWELACDDIETIINNQGQHQDIKCDYDMIKTRSSSHTEPNMI